MRFFICKRNKAKELTSGLSCCKISLHNTSVKLLFPKCVKHYLLSHAHKYQRYHGKGQYLNVLAPKALFCAAAFHPLFFKLIKSQCTAYFITYIFLRIQHSLMFRRLKVENCYKHTKSNYRQQVKIHSNLPLSFNIIIVSIYLSYKKYYIFNYFKTFLK